MLDDAQLLRSYVAENSDAAFAELVRRHIDLVYSAALRQVEGDAHRAEDVTQQVFTLLARKADSLTRHPALTGWLYLCAQHAATRTNRNEWRRRAREQKAAAMMDPRENAEPVLDWERTRPVLDAAMRDLGEEDREAVLLRFFARRPFAEIGAVLRVSEDGARRRVERALDKLHGLLTRRGVTSTAAALGAALESHAVTSAPAGLAGAVTGPAMIAAAKGSGAIFMGITKLQLGLGALAAVGVAAAVIQAQTNDGLRREIATATRQQTAIDSLRTENQQLTRVAAEVASWRNDDAELARLSEEASALRRTQTTPEVGTVLGFTTTGVRLRSGLSVVAASGEGVQISFLNAGLSTVFRNFENLTGTRIVRDAAVNEAAGVINLKLDRVGKPEAIEALRVALRDQANILLETAPDGTVTAKLGPSR